MADVWTRVLGAFSPRAPDDTQEAERLYVPRLQPLAEQLARLIREEPGVKALLAGQRGIGKSHELRHLEHLLRGSHLTCRLDAEEQLPPDLGPLEVLVGAVAVMYRAAGEAVDRGPLTRIARGLTDLAQRFGGSFEFTAPQLLAMVGVNFSLGFRIEPRQAERDPQVAQVLASIEDAIAKVQEACGRPVLWIVGRLHVLRHEAGLRLFAESGLLTRPSCAAVYTIPFELYQSPELQSVWGYFTPDAALAVPLAPPAEAAALLRQMVERRLVRARAPAGFVEPAALDVLFSKSGGVPRRLMELVRVASRLRGNEKTLTRELVSAAAGELGLQMQRGLDERRMAYLCRVWRGQPSVLPDDFPEAERARLLANLYLLYYTKEGDPPAGYYAVNPLLEPYLERECPKLTPSSSA